jgi:Holliday junction resolvase-like predicted endonuclease
MVAGRSNPIKLSEAVLQVAERLVVKAGSAIEVMTLVRRALRIRPIKRGEDPIGHELIGQELYKAAKLGACAVCVAAYPSFKLRRRGWPRGVVRRGYVGAAYRVLTGQRSHGRYVDVREVARLGLEQEVLKTVSQVPEYWMYVKIRESPGLFAQSGNLSIGLSRPESARGRRRPLAGPSPAAVDEGDAHLTRRMYERDLESLVAARPEMLEKGLRLVRRQYPMPVGRIDLLCRDKVGALVAVEAKSFEASTRGVVGQIARYMGYLRLHVAKRHQLVRGIIVVGQADADLRYAVLAIPNVEIKTFEVKVVPAPAPSA